MAANHAFQSPATCGFGVADACRTVLTTRNPVDLVWVDGDKPLRTADRTDNE